MSITAQANGKTFTFPDGTNPADMGQAIDGYFSQQGGAASAPKPQGSMPQQPITPQQTSFGDQLGLGTRNVIEGVSSGLGTLVDPLIHAAQYAVNKTVA